MITVSSINLCRVSTCLNTITLDVLRVLNSHSRGDFAGEVCQRGEGIHGDCRCSPMAGGTIHPKCRGVGIMNWVYTSKEY